MKIDIVEANALLSGDAPSPEAFAFATRLVRQVCYLCGDLTLVDDTPRTRRLRRAVKQHDTAWIFEWFISAFSYQGI